MQRTSAYSGFIITFTFAIALLLMVIPLPSSLENYRPEWLLLMIIYWAAYAPKRVSIGIGWMSGLLLDVLQGTLLGEYALVGMITAYVANQLHQRLQLFPTLQQCIFVFLLLGTQFILIMWIQGFSGHPIQGWQYGLPIVVSAILWPFIKGLMGWLQRRYKIK
jgi:rod shape-determining protein MreD